MTTRPRTPVLVLLRACRPAAVCLVVWAVVVDAIEGMLIRWARSHVGEERFEGAFPTLANCDAASTVETIRDVARSTAPALHAAPRLVLARVFHAVARMVRSGSSSFVASRQLFGSQAPAAQASAVSQRAAVDVLLATADTSAAPLPTKWFKGYPPPERLAGDINKFWHFTVVYYETRFPCLA